MRTEAKKDHVFTRENKKCLFWIIIFALSGLAIITCQIFTVLYGIDTRITLEAIFIFYLVSQFLYEIYHNSKESSKRKVRKILYLYIIDSPFHNILIFQADLEFKRMFVRYISHEVRTPLNTAIMGLHVLAEEMNRNKYINHDTLDTLNDIKNACDVSVNVLNELLIFDKLESGNLMLEMTRFPVMPFIEEVVRPFQAQVNNINFFIFFEKL